MPEPPIRFLRPGELAFTSGVTHLKTLLGSCVAVTLWHPASRQGAMCHFLLPANPQPSLLVDGRYGVDALGVLHRHFEKLGISVADLQAGLFGGGDVTGAMACSVVETVGARNVGTARLFLQGHGYRIHQEEVRGRTGRTIHLDPVRGTVTVRIHGSDMPMSGGGT